MSSSVPTACGRALRAGTLLADMSTSPPALARRLASECAELDVLDAPVSGGPRGAEDASLTIMVGGEEVSFQRALPLFEALGRLVVLVGPHGAGQTAKLCNNLIAGATMAAIAESCAIATREGIDPRVLYELVSASTGDSRVLRTRFPLTGADDTHPSSQGFAPLFALDLIAKDMELALELAEAQGVDASVARAALAAYATRSTRAGRARLLGGLPPLRSGRGGRVGSPETPTKKEDAARWQIPSSSPRRSWSKAA